MSQGRRQPSPVDGDLRNGRDQHLFLLLPPRDMGTARSPTEKSYGEISNKRPNKSPRRVHVCTSPIPHHYGFFHQEQMQCRHHVHLGHPHGKDQGALPNPVQKQTQKKQRISHHREVGLMIREEKINTNPDALHSHGLLSGTKT